MLPPESCVTFGYFNVFVLDFLMLQSPCMPPPQAGGGGGPGAGEHRAAEHQAAGGPDGPPGPPEEQGPPGARPRHQGELTGHRQGQVPQPGRQGAITWFWWSWVWYCVQILLSYY